MMSPGGGRPELDEVVLDRIARAIHDKYRRDQRGRKPAGDPAMQPWEKLADHLRASSQAQAAHIPAKLRAIDCRLAPAGGKAAVATFTALEVERLAELEHERWVTERRGAGWTQGPLRDAERRITPYLVPWEELAEEIREYDREAVRGIPGFLAEAGLEVRRG
jgi:hypothetical protein